MALSPSSPKVALEQSVMGRRVMLRPLLAEDSSWLYELAVRPGVNHRWRFRGSTPSPSEFDVRVWHGVEQQFVLVSRDGNVPFGLVQLYNVDHRNGTGFLSVLMSPESTKLGWPLEGVIIYIDLIFRTFPMRKLYFESLDVAYDDYKSLVARGLLNHEAVLEAHEYYDGEYIDLHILSALRSTWIAQGELFERFLQGA